MTDKGIYRILFPAVPVSPKITGLETDCSHCGGAVAFLPDPAQVPNVRPSRGSCGECGARHTLVQCGRCHFAFVMNEEQVEGLMRTDPFDCPQPGCGATLTHYPEVVGIHAFTGPNPSPWGDDPREVAFITRAAEKLADDAPRLARFWASHHCTGSRLKGAIGKLAALHAMTPHTFSIEVEGAAGSMDDNFDAPADDEVLYFDFVNTLRSSLEMLAQEFRAFFQSDVQERRVSVFTIPDLSPAVPMQLRELHRHFVGPEDPVDITRPVRYLNALRNTMQHRYLAVTKVHSSFQVSNFVLNDRAPLKPFHTSTILVDDPRCNPGEETYNRDMELLQTFDRILQDSHEFILRCYEIAITVDEGPA